MKTEKKFISIEALRVTCIVVCGVNAMVALTQNNYHSFLGWLLVTYLWIARLNQS